MKTKRRRDVKRRVKFMMIKIKICSHKAIIKKNEELCIVDDETFFCYLEAILIISFIIG